ncbi:MAG: IS21 family transposase [Erysipelotrichaceae bacterium]|nr:IS21 family transposase [Erysipelotrichaceae bacterium]MDY3092558.1 IS21 family transposase [Erysipelotrichaceae bacterium]MDY5654153.1 IS21 family transposase [Erysipelotrichaceae bacterium]
MARKIRAKLILRLHECNGLSGREICKIHNMSRTSVAEVFSKAREKNITYESIADKSEQEVYKLLFPDKYALEDIYEPVDYEYVHKEMSKTGVTLKLLWQEYCDSCNTSAKVPCGYTKFCRDYDGYSVTKNLTKRIERKPGERIEVDWSGPTMSFTVPETGEVIKVYLFVAVLSYSMYAYVEPTLDMKMDTWIRCNVNMFNFIGGVTRRIICDNLKTGVTSHPKEGDIILTDNYEALGQHYITAIMPAGIRKPKQKPCTEGVVGDIATAIIAKLRNKKLKSFEELKYHVDKALNEYNDTPFQKRDGSRTLAYMEEKEFLRPLPDAPFEVFTMSKGHVVGLNCHVQYKKNYYSVPYNYARNVVDLKISENTIDVFSGNERIASHRRFPDYVKYKYSTDQAHMPDKFNNQEWDDIRIKKWADSIGDNTRKVIDKIFDSCQIKEQGYNPTLSVLRLSKTYSQDRLENACELALLHYKVPRYHHLKALLSSNQDILYIQNNTKNKDKRENEKRGYLRGSDYYKEK